MFGARFGDLPSQKLTLRQHGAKLAFVPGELGAEAFVRRTCFLEVAGKRVTLCQYGRSCPVPCDLGAEVSLVALLLEVASECSTLCDLAAKLALALASSLPRVSFVARASEAAGKRVTLCH